MTVRASSGFTIIETVLFLGITGLMVLGMMVGVGASVNVQRYRDASESFKSLIQAQYADVNNVQNGRTANWVCNSAAAAIPDAGTVAPGQSDCMIVGKYVRIEQGKVSSYTVLARERPGVTPSDSTDITALKEKYVLNIARTEVVTSQMEWGTEIARPIPDTGSSTARTPYSVALLFVRSPESGQIYTFNSDTVPTDKDIESLSTTAAPSFIADMLVGGLTTPGRAERVLCVESSGLFSPGQNALYIAPYATDTNSVELVSNDTLKQKGLKVSC